MIREMTGDLIRDGKGILCHQVNFQGVMGGGIAYSIRQILPPKEFDKYWRYCMIHGRNTIGTVLWSKLPATGRVVANMFCQQDYYMAEDEGFAATQGYTPKAQTLTDYQAMRKCFIRVRAYAKRYNLPVYIPAYIGCGIAGGSWERVMPIIRDVFGGKPVDVFIVRWEKECRA